MLQLEVDCEKTHLVCDIIPGMVKEGQSEEQIFRGVYLRGYGHRCPFSSCP